VLFFAQVLCNWYDARWILKTKSQNIRKWRNGGIINPLFYCLTYNTSGHFAHCSYFPPPPLQGSEKYYAIRKISVHIIGLTIEEGVCNTVITFKVWGTCLYTRGRGGDTPWNFWLGCTARISKSRPNFRLKKCHFPLPFSGLASKIHTRFQT